MSGSATAARARKAQLEVEFIPDRSEARAGAMNGTWHRMTSSEKDGADTGSSDWHWWQRRWCVLALSLLAAVPLLWPDIPPLVDLPGHMGRYRVELEIANSPLFQQWYSFRWELIGNLGIDLLILPFGKLLGVELGTKLIVIAIPV